MKIKFCGAAREVTGSSHLIILDSGYKILLDCGLYQGRSADMKHFNTSWQFEPTEVDCLILSHAHIDHSGRIPKLVRDGFTGCIHSTHATRSLCSIMLVDSAKIQERDAAYFNKKQLRKKSNKDRKPLRDPLYTADDVRDAMKLFKSYPYERWSNIHPGVDILFRDAGHILGSASVTLRITEKGKTTTIGFTGDIGRPNRPILRDPLPMPEVDYLICESTYGDKDHEALPEQSSQFLKVIKETCCDQKGKLIIPAFSVGRTQELVYMLDKMETAGVLPRIPVYVDSPLAVNATVVFASHPECFDNDLHEYMLVDDNPFGFNALTYVRDVEVSKGLNTNEDSCIIISSSGMMNAGRVRHHLFNSIENKNSTILIVGYCSPETPGGRLRNGATYLRMFGEEKQVKARIETMDSFSAHADRNEILDFIKNQRGHVKRLFLVHGTLKRQEKFRDFLAEEGFRNVEIPELGQEVALK